MGKDRLLTRERAEARSGSEEWQRGLQAYAKPNLGLAG